MRAEVRNPGETCVQTSAVHHSLGDLCQVPWPPCASANQNVSSFASWKPDAASRRSWLRQKNSTLCVFLWAVLIWPLITADEIAVVFGIKSGWELFPYFFFLFNIILIVFREVQAELLSWTEAKLYKQITHPPEKTFSTLVVSQRMGLQ